MITSEQKAHFGVFGFLVIRQMFSPDEVTVITREFEAAMLEARGGKPFDGKEQQQVINWYHGRPAVEFLTTDERIRGPIEQLLGPGYTLAKIREVLLAHEPATLKFAVFLDKVEMREVSFDVDYVGYTIPPKWVVGYGLDCAEQYRELSSIRVVDPAGDENGP